jgi:phage terminase Nu1 subunit (DNA packaging protein)
LHEKKCSQIYLITVSEQRIGIIFVMSSQVKTTIMAAHAEGSHVNTTTTSTKNCKTTKTTETTTEELTSSSSSSSSSQNSNSKFLSPSSSPTTQHIGKSLPTFQSSRLQSTTTTIITKTTTIPTAGARQKCWLALVRWDPHLFPPTHGYYILKDRQGLQRFVKAENLLPSNKRRHYPRKLRFSSNVAIKFIARKDDPINADAWNTEYHRMVQRNSYWQQQQWRLEQEGKNRHRRLVVSSIAMRDFRRTVLPTLMDHGQRLRTKWEFRKFVAPRLADHSHGLRWKWALQRHHSKAPFQQFILSALPGHHQRLRLKWQAKEDFSRKVTPFLVDHSIRMRLMWALQHAQQQHQEMENAYDDDDDEDHPLRLKWALQHQHARLNFHEAILGSLETHCQSLKLRWGLKKIFRQTVLPSLADHSLRMRFAWALRHAELQDREMGHDDYGFHDDDDDDDDDDRKDDDDNFDDDDNITVATAPPPTIRPPRQRPSGIPPSTTTSGATIWVNGLRRSRRLQPTLGSIFENGRRRSARFL